MSNHNHLGLVLRVDEDDRIVAVNQEWIAFAHEGGSCDLERDTAIGEPLWRLITDCTIRHIYPLLLGVVRVQGDDLKVEFRCDRPTVHRMVELVISRLRDGCIELRAKVVRSHRPNPLSHADHFVTICGWCQDRVRSSMGVWGKASDAVQDINLILGSPKLTHGICPSCLDEEDRELSGGVRLSLQHDGR